MTAVDVFASVRGPVVPRPFPFAPLMAIAGLSLNQLALRLGAGQSTLSRCVLAGCTDEQADRWAVALGYHPSEVWPDEWYAELPEDAA